MHIWSLPGPAHYLEQAMAALRDGCNVLMPVPSHGMSGLWRALEQKCHADGWDCQSIPDTGDAPVDQIFFALGLEDAGSIRRTVSSLMQRMQPGQVVLIHGVGQLSWRVWKAFLSEYESASRNVGTIERPLVILMTDGIALKEMPERGAALRVLVCDNVIGEIDTLLYATTLLRAERKADYKLKLVARIICRLALWDLNLVRFLTEQRPETLLDPARVLNDALRTLGMPAGLTRTWESGGVQRFDDEACVHPFIVVNEGDPNRELAMRLWAAQAAEILPVLELQRRQIVRRMRGLVSMPIQVDGRTYDDLDDLEIGLLSHLAHAHSLGSIGVKATKLKRLRNSLAHLEALGATDVFDADLFAVSQTV